MSNNELEKYYKSYHEKMGDKGYIGDRHNMTSRFLLFKEQINQYVPKGGRILDIGCGSATFAEQSPDYEWHGLDWDVSPANGKPVTALVHNIEQTPYPYPDGYFDAIVCSEVLEHLVHPINIHKEARRLLKKGGHYFMSTPQHTWIVNIVNGFQNLVYNPFMSHTIEHIRTYTYDSHRTCLAEAGFGIDEYVGCDAHYDGIINPMLSGVREMIREKYNTDVSIWEMQLAAGKAHPAIQHTIFLRATKV